MLIPIFIFRFLGGCLSSHTNCYTLEVSLFGSSTGDVHVPYTEDDCILQQHTQNYAIHQLLSTGQ